MTVWDLSKNLVEHNTFIPSELQSCKFKYSFLTEVFGNLLINVYRALILTRIEYGCQAYNSATRETLQILDVIHNHAIRICLGAFKTTPLNSLYVESNISSLEKRRQFLSLEYYFKTLQIEKERRHSNNIFDIKLFNNLNVNALGP